MSFSGSTTGFSKSTVGAGVVLGGEEFEPSRGLLRRGVYSVDRCVVSLPLVDMFAS